MTKRSPLFYVGDKRKLIDSIKIFFPENINRFIEPFVGGGSVFMNVCANEFFLNDINQNVIEIHKMLCFYKNKIDDFFKEIFSRIHSHKFSCSYREDCIPEVLKSSFPKTYYAEFNRESYNQLKKDYNSSNNKDYLDLYILLIYGFNRILRFNSKGEFNVPVGNVDFNENVYNALIGYFTEVSSKTIQWSSLDFQEFFNKLQLKQDDFIYLDPPYLITFSEYNKMWNMDNEKKLLEILDYIDGSKIKFAISNVTHYKERVNSVFLKWADKYNSHPIKSNYISYHNNSSKLTNEVLVTNY